MKTRVLMAGVISALATTLSVPRAQAAPAASLTVQVNKPGHAVPPTLYGIFFEEINHAGDGGLYAELVRNRSFEDADSPDGWTLVKADATQAAVSMQPTGSGASGRALKLDITSGGVAGVRNDGYWGMNIQSGAEYHLSVTARGADGFKGTLTAQLKSASGQTLAEAQTTGLTGDWSTLSVTLKATGADPKAHLVLQAGGPGTVLLDFVSLFPTKTFKDRPNGLRPDLAAMLDDLRPAFVRFPGGCWVEGDRMAGAQRWKTTIGPLAGRRTQYNLWQYMSGNGLGFHEYLQMSEDLKSEPLFVINCGMSHRENVPMDQMGEFVQDALDAIEYANGSVTSEWGAKRAANGHPAPFGLKYLEIGNENGGPAYEERYPLFVKAIKKAHPDIHLIANVWGGTPKSAPAEIVDEHYYSSPSFFINNAHKYDSYDRKGPKVYVGEYAVTEGSGAGNMAAALGEAAFMTGMERNSDVVVMTSYAPLFANVNYKRWNPDLINFDSSRVYGTPSYYVQKLFSQNRPDVILPATVNAPVAPMKESASGGIGLGTWNTQSEYKDVQVTKGSKVLYASDFAKGADEWKPQTGTWSVQDGAYRQSGDVNSALSFSGDSTWTDYTLTLKARKISGAEGFLILVRVHDSKNWVWWNLGGWGNTRDAIERNMDGGKNVEAETPGHIETGRWYDIKVEVAGHRMKCYLDGVLKKDITQIGTQALYAVAGRTNDGEVIVKVVNVSDKPCNIAIRLEGATSVDPAGMLTVMSSASKADENTLDAPTKVAPKDEPLKNVKPRFNHTFPARSVTVMRLKAAAQ